MKAALLVKRIEDSLREDREEALADGEECASEEAVAACQRLASHIANWLQPPNKWAAFGEDGGGVLLVLRSLDAGRRVDFRISPCGLNVGVICIDENMRAETESFRAVDWGELDVLDILDNYAKWVMDTPGTLPGADTGTVMAGRP